MKLTLLFSVLLFSFSTLSSCKKEGCTDKLAKNYNAKAKKDNGTCSYVMGCTDETASNFNVGAAKDDGTCEFMGKAIFWTDCYGCCEVEVSIEGELKGRTVLSFTEEPDVSGCYAAGCANVEMPAGTYSWSAVSTCYQVKYSGTVKITTNDCVIIQI